MVRADNNPLTYVLSSARLDATGHRWVACLANYNFSLEYQKGKDNTVADYLSRVEDRLPSQEVKEYENKIPIVGVKALLNNAGTSIEERVEVGDCLPVHKAQVEETLSAFPMKLVPVHTTNWKQAQKEDPVLYTIVKNWRASREDFKKVLKCLLDKKSIQAYVKMRPSFIIKDGLLYQKTRLKQSGEEVFRFVVSVSHRGTALDGCHREAVHQFQHRSLSLMQEYFWWPGMAQDIVQQVKDCTRCKKYEGAPPIAKLQKLPCSSPGEIVHIDFTSIEETVGLHEEPVIKHVLIIQDHFSKHVVAYVVKDQVAKAASDTLRSGYFGLFV